jgi:hypothetical protein
MELPEAKVAGCDRRLFRFRKAKAGAFAYNAGMHVEMIGPSHSAGRETYRRIGVSAFAKHHQLRRDPLVIIAMSKSSLTSPGADTPIRRTADALPQPPPVSETSTNSRMGNILVYRLAYNVMSPQVSWLLFKARAKRPYLDPCGSIRRGGGKTANRPRPGGLR